MKKNCHQRGFTLIEILIVIALLSIFVVLGFGTYMTTQQRARNARKSSDLKTIQGALEQYFTSNAGYPDGCNFGAQLATYFPQGFPRNPQTDVAYAPVSCTTSAYCYCVSLEPDTTTSGNSTAADCNSYAPGAIYCVENLQ